MAGGVPIDTIVAAITPPGAGERAAVRLSGPDAFALAGRVLRVDRAPQPGLAGAGRLDLGQGVGVDVLLLGFRAPHSLTGEDVVEVHLPGWPALVTELLLRLVAAGGRPAERGEFSRRAVATGRRDLSSVLAVQRLVAARTVEEAAAVAAAVPSGVAGLHGALREALLAALALVEAHVDFEEEDTEAIDEDAVRRALDGARTAAARLHAAGAAAAPADGETDVALLGPPNAGKSLLFLALCPGAETTVSPCPGTTRDTLEARVTRDGRRWRLLDGPGLDRAAEGRVGPGAPGAAGAPRAPDAPGTPAAPSPLDLQAMDLYVRNLPRAALALLVTDAAVPASERVVAELAAVAGPRSTVRVLGKCDLLPDPAPGVRPDGAVAVSALRRTGLDALWDAIGRAAPAPAAPDLLTRAERDAAGDVLATLSEGSPAPLAGRLPEVALLLRDAVARLDAAAPAATSLEQDVLDRIFSSFCIGK